MSVDGLDRNGVTEELSKGFPILNLQPFAPDIFVFFPGLHLLGDRQFSPPHESFRR